MNELHKILPKKFYSEKLVNGVPAPAVKNVL